MKGILLANMGGAESLEGTRFFLKNMFLDPNIIPAPKLVRFFLSKGISTFRYKKSWAKYQLIGGTPIIKASKAIADSLNNSLGDDYRVLATYSYSRPLIEESVSQLINEGITDIRVIPLYPQASHTTTRSVKQDLEKLYKKWSYLSIKLVDEFHTNKLFIDFWRDLIVTHIRDKNYRNPTLVFSAHSIPLHFVEKGDNYPKAIEESAKNIAAACNLPYQVAFQSQMEGQKWVEPKTFKTLTHLKTSKIEEIVLIPISFVNENLETLFDLDQEMIPRAKSELNFTSISRVKIPEIHPIFIELLAQLSKK